ncbi:MAG: hypothetical protein KDE27_02695 [Planctomycetes bacterium]|nr:hypothetical protein [Planctomycetota bacterium]
MNSRFQTLLVRLAAATFAICAASAGVQAQTPGIDGEISVAKAAVFEFDPVFLALGIHTALPAAQYVELPLSLVEVEKQVGGNWVGQPTYPPASKPLRLRLEAGDSHWVELPIWDSRVLELPGTYRVRFTFRHSDTTGPTTAEVQSPWQTLTVASHAANVAAMQVAGVRAEYDRMLASGFGRSGRPGAVIADLDETLVLPLQAVNLSTDLRTFASVILAHRRLGEAEAEFEGTAAQVNALNAASALVAGLSSQSYGGKVGGLGAHLIYAQALTDWYRATTVQQFDQATALFQTIASRFSDAGSTYERESLEWIRELRF